MYNIPIDVNGQRVPVEVSAYDILYVANKIETDLINATQKLVVFCADATNWNNGITTPAVGIRKAESIGGREASVTTGDVNWLIAGTLRRIDNDEEIVRINHLMRLGYENAYVELRGQTCACGTLAYPQLGKRRIIDLRVVGDMVYLTLVPMNNIS